VVEGGAPHSNIRNFSSALWWAAATITTVGSEKYPVTDEGRVLAVLVMLYGLAFAGYIAATLVTLLIGRENGSDDTAALRDEIAALRRELEARRALSATGAPETDRPPDPPADV
jgi:voltage-gated potassium channel